MSKRKHIVAIQQPKDLNTMMNDVIESFQNQAREAIRSLVHNIFEEEVTQLCGPSHARGRDLQKGLFRAGSDVGSVKVSGQRMAVRKPRVKRGRKDIKLTSYKALKDADLLTAKIMEYMVRGVSTRDYGELLDELAGSLGMSKSAVSRYFIKGSQQCLEKLQTRSLKDRVFCAVFIDAIHFANRSVIVAVGLDGSGTKMMLGLREGNTESAEVCKDLLQSLIDRGLPQQDPARPFLFVVDGGKGLRRAIRDVYGEDFPVQRCWIHKARNIKEYLPEQTHGEFYRRWNYFRRIENYADARAEQQKLRAWLYKSTPSAAASLDEAGEELLTALRLGGTGQFLKRTLTTTNTIEGIFSQVRSKSIRVKNWRSSGDQIQRWVATCLLQAEKRCNRVYGHFECGAFIERMKVKLLQSQPIAA